AHVQAVALDPGHEVPVPVVGDLEADAAPGGDVPLASAAVAPGDAEKAGRQVNFEHLSQHHAAGELDGAARRVQDLARVVDGERKAGIETEIPADGAGTSGQKEREHHCSGDSRTHGAPPLSADRSVALSSKQRFRLNSRGANTLVPRSSL